MHELGILREIVRTVDRVAQQNQVQSVKHITLEVGEYSGIVPMYMNKMFPVATDAFPILSNTELRMIMVPGKGLMIKDIGY